MKTGHTFKITMSRGRYYIRMAPPDSTVFESADDGFFNTRAEAEARIQILKKYYP